MFCTINFNWGDDVLQLFMRGAAKTHTKTASKHPTLSELPACEDRVIASIVDVAVFKLAQF